MKISPMKNYLSPNFPTLEQARENPDFLKTVPRRWRKKAAVLACAGFFGLAVFAGCGSRQQYVPQFAETEIRAQLAISELNFGRRGSYGGDGSTPFYVAYFTEAEAWGLIRAHLEAAGLNFDATPPRHIISYTFTSTGFPRRTRRARVGLDLFDEEKNVGVAFVENNFHARLASREFDAEDMTVGVFFNAEESLEGFLSSPEAFVGREDEARQNLIERLEAQAETFLERLQSEGVF